MLKNQLAQKWGLPPTSLRFLIIVLLVIGVFFRFVNLDRKVYWHDEAYTSLRVSGTTQAELIQQIFDGEVVSVEDLQKYQRPNPKKGLIDTIDSLALEDSQHPPLYYLMVRWWMQWFGNSVQVVRSLSALLSLLVFPCVYWLCLELFDSPLVAWVAIALFAVSPFHVLYAQEAREYVLWTVTILLSSAALLRAMRLKTKTSWVIYALTVALGLYSFLFSGLVVIAHAIYVFATSSCRLTKTVAAFVFASITGILIFVPWILVVITHLSQIERTTTSAQRKLPLVVMVTTWANNLVNIFVDFWRANVYFPDSHFPNLPVGPYFILFILFLVGYSLYFIYRKTEKKVGFFVLTLVAVPALALILPDLIVGGKLSARTRYLIPSYLGIQLAVAYLLAAQIISSSSSRRKLWQAITAIIITGGIVSCAISSQAETWWSKGSHYNPRVARIINSTAHPLVVSSNDALNFGELLSLSHLLDPKVRLQLVVEPNIPNIPDNFSNVFLFNPSKNLTSGLETKYKAKMKVVYKLGRLWQLEKKNSYSAN